MGVYVAMLRGVNVGGKNKVKMSDLHALFVDLGHADVTTYIQSGNVVFTSREKRAPALTSAIEERIVRDLGIDVAIALRTKAELGKVIAGNPFARNPFARNPFGGVDLSKLHVTFLASKPETALVRGLADHSAPPDEFRIVGREVYVHCPAGSGNTKLNNAFWERRLKTAATARNWNTVSKLFELAGSIDS